MPLFYYKKIHIITYFYFLFYITKKIKTKYNAAGLFSTQLNVKNLIGKNLKFKIIGIGGETISKNFELLPQEVL